MPDCVHSFKKPCSFSSSTNKCLAVRSSGLAPLSVLTGSIIILAIALAFVRWIGAHRTTDLLLVGFLWLVLTLAFEILFGRFVVGASWERLAADYNVLEGGLLPFGMLVLLLSPLIAGKVRGVG